MINTNTNIMTTTKTQNLIDQLNKTTPTTKASVSIKILGGEKRYVCFFDKKVIVKLTEDEMISFLDGMFVMKTFMFMQKNGIGEKDMISDITYPNEI